MIQGIYTIVQWCDAVWFPWQLAEGGVEIICNTDEKKDIINCMDPIAESVLISEVS